LKPGYPGVQFFDCFENNSKSRMYELMKDASINGMVNRIAKKLNKSIEELNHDIFLMFNQEEITLSRVPVNVLNYSVTKSLSDELIEEIHETLKIRMENRLINFEKLVSFISRKEDPIKIITKHLGIA
jgi:hypothetical protein